MFSSLIFLSLYIIRIYYVYDFRYIEVPIHLLVCRWYLHYILQEQKDYLKLDYQIFYILISDTYFRAINSTLTYHAICSISYLYKKLEFSLRMNSVLSLHIVVVRCTGKRYNFIIYAT